MGFWGFDHGSSSGYRGFFGCEAVFQTGRNGGVIRTCDLEVMSLASYRAAPPRDMTFLQAGTVCGGRSQPVYRPRTRA